jgi:hypothetical protein
MIISEFRLDNLSILAQRETVRHSSKATKAETKSVFNERTKRRPHTNHTKAQQPSHVREMAVL